LEDLLPENNLSRPVRLINVDNNSIEWQGFLSCEAYSQDYTSIPQVLQLRVISVLEAMDSVQINSSTTNGLKQAFRHIYDALHEIDIQSGIENFTHVDYPVTDWRIFLKYIDATVFYETKEYNNENSTTYIISGLSCKDIVERMAKYMGWCVREYKTRVIFERIGENFGLYQETLNDFGTNFHHAGTISNGILIRDIATYVEWMGVGHKCSVEQGAKSVEVVARLEKYDVESSLPAFPYGDTESFYKKYGYGYGSEEWLYLVAAKNLYAYSNLSYKYFKGTINIPLGVQVLNGEVTLEDLLDTMLVGANCTFDEINIGIAASPPNQAVVTGGAFLAQTAYETQQQSGHSTNDGLYVAWLPQAWNTQSHYDPSTGTYINTDVFEDLDAIFKMNSLLSVNIPNGYLKLSANMTHIVYEYDDYEYPGTFHKEDNWQDKLLLHIRVGNKYWNGTTWVESLSKTWIDIDGSNFKKNWTPTTPVPETDGYLIPVNTQLLGDLEIGIYAPIHAVDHGFKMLVETFFSSLDLDYLELSDSTLTNRSDNHYFRLLATNFRDEISIDTNLASMLNNSPSPSLIMNDGNGTDPMKTMEYTILGGTESRRPEVDLLDRLAIYYGAARQRLELEVAQPTLNGSSFPLPLLKLKDINYNTNNKIYLPLSESIDWKTDVCKLTCFETPNNE
jgi:hypothetical protein